MEKLREFATEIRRAIINEIGNKGGGHIGGSLSIVEILAVLYGEIMNVRPDQPDWEGRDYLVCSKGHAGPAIYATLALKGFMPLSNLNFLNKGGSKLPGHCDRKKVPGVDATTGSLGQGLSIACGIAVGLRAQGRDDQKVFCILGDGECDEGQIWEATQFASHYSLSNLCVFLDWNKKQIDGSIENVMSHRDFEGKFRAFGWNAKTVMGNNVDELYKEMKEWKDNHQTKPTVFVCDTVKGAGISCIEAMEDNHCIALPKDLFETCLSELNTTTQKGYE